MLEHLTYNNSKHGRRERESKREGGEREIAREREREGGPQPMCSVYIHIIHIAPNEEELAGSSRGRQSKHQLQIVSERSAWRPQGQARQSERNC